MRQAVVVGRGGLEQQIRRAAQVREKESKGKEKKHHVIRSSFLSLLTTANSPWRKASVLRTDRTKEYNLDTLPRREKRQGDEAGQRARARAGQRQTDSLRKLPSFVGHLHKMLHSSLPSFTREQARRWQLEGHVVCVPFSDQSREDRG